MIFRQLFDRETCTYTYLLADEETHEAVLIDSVREHFERDRGLLLELGLTLKYTSWIVPNISSICHHHSQGVPVTVCTSRAAGSGRIAPCQSGSCSPDRWAH